MSNNKFFNEEDLKDCIITEDRIFRYFTIQHRSKAGDGKWVFSNYDNIAGKAHNRADYLTRIGKKGFEDEDVATESIVDVAKANPGYEFRLVEIEHIELAIKNKMVISVKE